MQNLIQDLRYSVRVLRTHPLFTLIAAFTLSLGIGANTAIFSVVNVYLFKPLPVKDAHQLVAIGASDQSLKLPHETSYPTYEDIRDKTDVFSDVIAYRNSVVNVNTDGQSERTWVELVSGNYFSMLGVEAFRGRTFTAAECNAVGHSPVMVLSYRYWQRKFGSNEAIIGTNINLNGQPFTIIGVAPKGFPGTEMLLSLDAYVPVTMEALLFPRSGNSLVDRSAGGLRVMARLKLGVELSQARAALNVLASQLSLEYPDVYKELSFAAYPEVQARPVITISSYVPTMAAIFMALVGLVLLIACANVANLILVRTTSRHKEFAIRCALGATRFSLIRLLLIESILLGVIGAAAGVLLALWSIDLLSSIRFSADAPVRFDLEPDWRVFVFTLFVALITGMIAGILPAFQSSRINLNDTLKEGGRSSAAASRNRFRSVFVIAQVAASFLLLICAGLFIRSMQESKKMDLGFRPDNLLLFSVDLELQNYDDQHGKQFEKQVIKRLKQLPQVTSASLASHVPLGYNNSSVDIYLAEQASTTKEDYTSIFYNNVAPDYFKTLSTPVMQGREFTERDDDKAPFVAVINQAMANKLWQNQNPLGKQFRLSRDGKPFEVVGVVKDGKYIFLGEEPRPFVFFPIAQRYSPAITVYLRSESNPLAIVANARQVVREMDSEMAVYDLKTMNSHLSEGLAFLFVRLGATLAGIFGLVGLVLAVVGIYGVISYSVSQRSHEIAVRMALGAKAGDVLKMVLRQGVILVSAGMALGLFMALGMTQYLSSLLYSVSPIDVTTYIFVTLILLSVALIACLVPARRAAGTDPIAALRYE